MIDDHNIEQHILKNINEICNKIEKESSLLILYDKEIYNDELYIDLRIYNTINNELVKHRFDKLINTYNYLNGIYFGIKFIKEG
jgi:hypothetical protein